MVESVNVALSNEEKPADQVAHEEAMKKVSDANDGIVSAGDETPKVTERPAEIPEKFWDAEKGEVNTAALLKSQADGEAALREANIKPKEDEVKPEDDDTAPKGDEVVTSEVINKASEAFAKNGELSESDYESLEKAGMPKPMVDEYIAGQKAIVANLESAAAAPFGGDFENYNKAADWAAEKLSEDEIKALDIQLTSTNPAIVKQGAAALQAKYAANADITPETVIHGDGTQTTSGTAFRSSAEMQAAMSDPRYKTDAAYRAEVAGKVSRSDSKLFG